MSEVSSAAGRGSWLTELVHTNRTPLQWDRVVLAAIGIAAPVGIALAVAPHDGRVIGIGSLASVGAMTSSMLDVGDVGIERVRRMLLVSATATLGFALGTIVYGHPIETVAAVVIAALVSGLSGTLGVTASKCALYFLVFAVTAANVSFGLAVPWMAPLVFLAGALWRVLLTTVWAAAAGTTLAPERSAVAAVYAAIADQLAASGTTGQTAKARQLTRALDHADDVMAAARTAVAVRDSRWQSLVRLLDGSAPAIDAAIAVVAAGERANPDTITFFRDTARWIASPSLGAPSSFPSAPATPAESALASSVAGIDRMVAKIDRSRAERRVDSGHFPVKRASFRQRSRVAMVALAGGKASWGAALRLALCMALAQAVALAWHLDRPYLVMVTVAQVMKPDFGSVIARALQRGSGTIVGVALGCLVVVLVPLGGWQILAIAVLAGLIPIAMARNYGLYSVVTTPLAVILVELHAGPTPALLESRVSDTVLGCAIVILAGYLPWPSTWHASRHIREDVAMLAQSIVRYLDVALAAVPSAPGDIDRRTTAPPGGASPLSPSRDEVRRTTYRHVSDVRTAVARSLAEPPPVSSTAASWLASIAALERVADEITAIAATLTASPADLRSADLAEVREALVSLSAGLSGVGTVGTARLPVTGTLLPLAQEVQAAREAVSVALARHTALPFATAEGPRGPRKDAIRRRAGRGGHRR